MTVVHKDDILVCGNLHEGRIYRHMGWPMSQIYPGTRADRLDGRVARYAFYTPRIFDLPQKEGTRLRQIAQQSLATGRWQSWGPIELWQPEEEPTLIEKIAALPEANACESLDYGRGFAEAIRQVLVILASAA